MMKWQIMWAYNDDTSFKTVDGCRQQVNDVEEALADGWEPFAVTTMTGAEKVWLRKPEQVVALAAVNMPDHESTAETISKIARIVADAVSQAYATPR